MKRYWTANSSRSTVRQMNESKDSRGRVVFLFDVDNTLLDNDRVAADLQSYLASEIGPDGAQEYWRIFEQLRAELGYTDYLGALQRYRVEHPRAPHLLSVSHFLMTYAFGERLFPDALKVIEHVHQWGPAVILSDGDVIFQPLKINHSGLSHSVSGRVLIYVHKEEELEDVERRYPAEHYVLVDDKLRILAAVKNFWGSRVTTVFVRQGHYATDPKILAAYPAADITVEHIGDLLQYDLRALLGPEREHAHRRGPTASFMS
jgi:FMN phosphatase YigB (HAD superfamily)